MTSDYSIYRDLVAAMMRGEETLPSLPQLTLQIRAALSRPDTSQAELERLISRDPGLAALLVKHASGALYRRARPARTVREAIDLLGLRQVGSITLAHSLKSLCAPRSQAYKLLYLDAWRNQVLKASTCAVLARELGGVVPEQALLASLLSDVGSLVLLSAFMEDREPVSLAQYRQLCREFGRALGVLLLKRWDLETQYIDVVRQAGEWQLDTGPRLQAIDLVNLALYHASLQREPDQPLPPLTELSAWRKLPSPENQLDDRGCLALIEQCREQIQGLARSFGGERPARRQRNGESRPGKRARRLFMRFFAAAPRAGRRRCRAVRNSRRGCDPGTAGARPRRSRRAARQ